MKSLTREFTRRQIRHGVLLGLVRRDVFFQSRPMTLNERLRLENHLVKLKRKRR